MDNPLLILVAGHIGAFALALAGGGLMGSPEAHRLLLGRLCAVGAVYLTGACIWADWVIAERLGALVAIGLPTAGALVGWMGGAIYRRLLSAGRGRLLGHTP